MDTAFRLACKRDCETEISRVERGFPALERFDRTELVACADLGEGKAHDGARTRVAEGDGIGEGLRCRLEPSCFEIGVGQQRPAVRIARRCQYGSFCVLHGLVGLALLQRDFGLGGRVRSGGRDLAGAAGEARGCQGRGNGQTDEELVLGLH